MIPLVTPPSITMSQKRSLGASPGSIASAPPGSAAGAAAAGLPAVAAAVARASRSAAPAITCSAARLGKSAYSVPRVLTKGVSNPFSTIGGAPSGRGLDLREDEALEVEIEAKYEAYIERQRAQVEKFQRMEQRLIPEDFDYSAV